MKRKTRKILMVLAMATISAFGVLFASCGASDWLNEKVDQLTCKHEYDDGIELESATCSEYGKVLKTCTICYYEKTEKIDKLPHTETVVAAEAPTCTKDGKTDGVVCSVCDEIIVRQKSVPKLGHDITILEAVKPTCLTSGKTEGQYCNRCNETVVEQKTLSALGHKVTTTYGKAATCTEDGLTNGQACARCATVYVAQEVIPATGHNFEDGECTKCDNTFLDLYNQATSKAVKYETVKMNSVLNSNSLYRVEYDMSLDPYTFGSSSVSCTDLTQWKCDLDGYILESWLCDITLLLGENTSSGELEFVGQEIDVSAHYVNSTGNSEVISNYVEADFFSFITVKDGYIYFAVVDEMAGLGVTITDFYAFFDCERVIV